MKIGTLSSELTFRDAFAVWIDRRVIDHAGVWSNARFISSRTERDLRQYARAAGRFFDTLALKEIHAGHLREYQKLRATNPPDVHGRWYAARGRTIEGPFDSREAAEAWARDRGDGFEFRRTAWERAAGANLIRKEIGTVVRVMVAAGAWTEHHEEVFEPLSQVDSDVSRAMTPTEQHAWLHVAGSREEWRLVYWWSVIALQTTLATNEMRALRLGDVYLEQGIVTVRSEGAKNKYRVRSIPLQTPEIVWALSGLIERARRLGADGPHCYLFPKHKTADRYDAGKPMTVWGMRKAWDAARMASGLAWLTPYCLRHTAITRLAEAGVPIQVIMSFAGHISARMQQHYTAISMESKRRWAAAAWQAANLPYMPPGGGQGSPQLPPAAGSGGAPTGGSAPVALGWTGSPSVHMPAWMRTAV